MLESLEAFVNELNDADHAWWPFLFLRPGREERMTSRRVAALAGLYGVGAGLLVNVLIRLGLGGSEPSPLLFPLAATVGFFALFRLTFAACWNRRAERVARGARE